jgi:hypothetical protein
MKLKVVVVDLEISPRAKRWALRLGIPAAILIGGGAVAYAGGLVTWTDGQTLKAADLNGNFSALQAQIPTPSAFSVKLTGTSPLVVTSGAAIVFTGVNFDLLTEYDTTTGAFVAKNAGTYMFTCSLYWRGNTGGTDPGSSWVNETQLAVNGTGVISTFAPTALNDDVSVPLTTVLSLKANDSVTCTATQSDSNTPGSLDIQMHSSDFSGVRIN